MDMGLSGKIAIVTGGASGIGKATVLILANEGAIPVFVDKDSDKGTELSNELKRQNRKSQFIHADLTDDEKCKYVVDETIKNYGKLDILINNAGKMTGVI